MKKSSEECMFEMDEDFESPSTNKKETKTIKTATKQSPKQDNQSKNNLPRFKFTSDETEEVKKEKIFSSKKWKPDSVNNQSSPPLQKKTNSLPIQATNCFHFYDSDEEEMIFSFDETIAFKEEKNQIREHLKQVHKELKSRNFAKKKSEETSSHLADTNTTQNSNMTKLNSYTHLSSPSDFFRQAKSVDELSTSESTDIIYVDGVDKTSPSNC